MQTPAQEWAPAVAISVITLTIGAVILLRPVMKRLGEFLELLIQEKRQALDAKHEVDTLGKRMQVIEERVDFTEKLISPGEQRTSAADADMRTNVTAT